MHVRLPYGEDSVPVDVPDNWINGRCFRARRLTVAADERAELLSALANPEGGVSLESVAEGRRNCVIAVDPAVPELFRELLPAFIEELEDVSSLTPSQIAIVVANRPWRPIAQDSLEALVGRDLMSRHPVALHDGRDTQHLVDLGESTRGIPLLVDARYVEADLKVVFGPVLPDIALGFTGGRSTVMPGLAGEKTLRQLYAPRNIAHSCTRYGNLRDNPLHVTALEALEKAGCDFSVGALVTADRKLSGVVCGDAGQAHMLSVHRMRERMEVIVKEPMDIVVASCAGAPHDLTIAGLVDTISAVEPVLKRDGTIVIAARLEQGLGSPEMERLLFGSEGPDAFRGKISQTGFHVAGQWIAQRMYEILHDHEVILYSDGLTEDQIWSIGLTPARDMQEAIHGAMESHGQRCKIVALPDGPLSIATLPSVPMTVMA